MTIGVTVTVCLDTRTQKKNGTFPVKIRVTNNSYQKHYPTGVDLLKEDFEKIMTSLKLRPQQKEIKDLLMDFENKARGIIKDMPFFDFTTFDKKFRQKRNVNGGLEHYFDEYAKQLRENNQLNSAEIYEVAKISLLLFRPRLKPHEITPEFLTAYERWMTEVEDKSKNKVRKSITTVGIYLRSLRCILNHYKLLPEELYPFGRGKYEMPSSRNIKKAVNEVVLAKLYNYQAILGKEYLNKARDLWFFLYYSNGMNVKDMCLLKQSDVSGNFLYYYRQKTKRTKRIKEQVQIAYTEDIRTIVRKYGVHIASADDYLFPFIKKEMTEVQIRERVKGVTKWINRRLRIICKDLGIPVITTQTARHTFASVLKRKGYSVATIQDLFKHGSEKTTQHYLDSIEDDARLEIGSSLAAFKQKHEFASM